MEKRPSEKLIAWQEAFSLCLWIYTLTIAEGNSRRSPQVKLHQRTQVDSLVSPAASLAKPCEAQGIQRSIHPLPHGRGFLRSGDTMRFFEIALGSREEVHCQCHIALGVAIIDEREMEEASSKIHRTSYLISKLRSSFA